MDIKLKVVKLTMESGNIVVKIVPDIVDSRAGDNIAGELFLTTTEENMVLGLDDEIAITFEDSNSEESQIPETI